MGDIVNCFMIDFRRDPSPTSTSERKREELEIKEKTQAEKHEVMDVLKTYGLTKEESTPIVED
ncbi:MAG: hypothetical protein ACJ795_25210 [Ktedonobacteraceae bacterium]